MITKVFRGRVESTSNRMAVFASFDENIVNIVPIDEIVDEYYNPDGTVTVKLRGAKAIGTFQIEEGGGKGGYDWSQPPVIPPEVLAAAQGKTVEAKKAGAGDAEARKKRAEKLKAILRAGKAPWLAA